MTINLRELQHHPKIDLRKLQHMVVLAETGSFAHASRKLHLTQPALTKSIKLLEHDFGLKLFDRTSTGTVLTAAGHTMLARARELLTQANSLGRDMSLLRDADFGNLSFGVGPLLSHSVTLALTSIAREHPSLQIRVRIQSPNHLMTLLRTDKVEFFLGDISLFASETDMVMQPFVKIPLGYFVRAAHPLARAAAIHTDELMPFPLVAPGFSDRRGPSPWSGLISSDDIGVLKQVTLQSDAILLTSYNSIKTELKSRRLRQLKFALNEPQASSDVHLVYRAGRSLSPIADVALNLIKATFSD